MKDITFANKKLRQICTDEKLQKRQLSGNVIKKLRLRYRELQVAETVSALQEGPGNWHPLTGNLKGHFAGLITGHKRIIICGTDDAGRENQWDECCAIQIVEIDLNYH